MKKVLVAPLDWGLGHTTRCIPLIEALIGQGAEVFFAGTKEQITFVQSHQLKLHYTQLEGYNVQYSAIWPQWVKVGFQSLRILKIIQREHAWLQAFAEKEKIDIVISDNRFGMYSANCKSIFITHQLSIPSPLLQRKANAINENYISKFDECWVPDLPKINLSGELSHSNIKHRYIGFLSRFRNVRNSSHEYDILLLLSGTEPQRGILEKKLSTLLHTSPYRVGIVRGTSNIQSSTASGSVYGLLNGSKLQELLSKSDVIVCRSGYSSLMDLITTGNRLFLVPTPGQPEQEYLAHYLHKKWNIPYCKQSEIQDYSAETIISAAKKAETRMDVGAESERLLKQEISRILNA